MTDIKRIEELAKLVRYYILRMTTKAGSGHPTSSLSATDIMVALFFGKLRFDLKNPNDSANDRMIFSKGHASPLLYALWGAAGILSKKELDAYRKFKSPLGGHPTPNFKYVEVATGSLGQGLSIGLGMALAGRLEFQVTGPVSGSSHPTSSTKSSSKLNQQSSVGLRALDGTPSAAATRKDLPKVYVLMGDSEMSEGSVWEAIQLASYHKVGNLVGIIDVNRLGQSGQTMLGWDLETYQKRFESFGWETQIVDGHDLGAIIKVLNSLSLSSDKPQMIIAKTVKGKGVSFLENKEGWHGKVLSDDQFEEAVKELGEIDKSIRGEMEMPVKSKIKKLKTKN